MRQAEAAGRLPLSPNATPCLHTHRTAEWRAEAPRRPVRRAPTLAPPVPSQVLTVSRLEGRLIPLVVYETHREDRAAGVWRHPSNGPCASRTAQLHARMRQRRLLPELLGMGAVPQFVPSAGREGVGGRVAGVCDPEDRGSVRSGPRASGFSPRLSHACSRGEGACFGAACQHRLSARHAPTLRRAMAAIALSPLSSMGSSLPLTSVYHPSAWVCTTPSCPPLSHIVEKHHPF